MPTEISKTDISNWQFEANRLRIENDELRKALEKYTVCRHSSINCFCTTEARAALYLSPEERKRRG